MLRGGKTNSATAGVVRLHGIRRHGGSRIDRPSRKRRPDQAILVSRKGRTPGAAPESVADNPAPSPLAGSRSAARATPEKSWWLTVAAFRDLRISSARPWRNRRSPRHGWRPRAPPCAIRRLSRVASRPQPPRIGAVPLRSRSALPALPVVRAHVVRAPHNPAPTPNRLPWRPAENLPEPFAPDSADSRSSAHARAMRRWTTQVRAARRPSRRSTAARKGVSGTPVQFASAR